MPASGSCRVIRLDLAYDGGDFRGYAKQPGLRTVQGEIEAVLSQLIDQEFVTYVAGRTDAGVHALGQVVSVHTNSTWPVEKLTKSLSKMLPSDIAVIRVTEEQGDFNARYSALARRYRYRLSAAKIADPTKRHNVWWTGPLPADRLSAAVASVVGIHDFRAFCRSPDRGEPTVREVKEASCYCPAGSLAEDELWIEIEANAFCHQMVRRIVGRCVAVSRGRCEVLAPGEIEYLGCAPAPPQGLYLVRVSY